MQIRAIDWRHDVGPPSLNYASSARQRDKATRYCCGPNLDFASVCGNQTNAGSQTFTADRSPRRVYSMMSGDAAAERA